MDNKGDRPSKIPAGTFASSVPPPPPPEAIAASLRPLAEPDAVEERKRFTRTLVDGAGASSRASMPPPVPEDARRPPTTLVGHTTHTTSAAPPPVPPAAVLSPPKWQGAKAYLEGREPKPRVSSIPNVPAITSSSAHASAIPSKVTTKLGNPTLQTSAARTESTFDSAQEQEAVAARAPLVQRLEAIDDVPVEELSSDELNELRASDPPPAAAAPSSSPPYVMPEVASTFVGAAPEPMRELPVLPPLLVQTAPLSAEPTTARAPEPEPVQAATAAAAAAAAARPAREPKATPTRPRRVTPAGPPSSVGDSAFAAGAGFAVSLAPAEAAARSEPDQRLGALLLAAITLLSAGGWWLTRGGFQRASHVAAATAPVAAVAPAPAAPPTVPSLGDPAPVAPAAAAPVPAAEPAVPAAPVAPAEAAPAEPSSHPIARPTVARRSPPTPPLQPPSSVVPPAEAVAPTPPLPPAAEASPGTLPPTPSRQDVVSALEPLRAGVQQCAGNLRGIAQLDVTVASNGSVTHAVVAGDFAGTPEGSCIARIARSAKFAPFERPRFRVIYPYAL